MKLFTRDSDNMKKRLQHDKLIFQGACIDQVGTYSCVCQDGFSGDRCQLDVNECLSNPCFRADKCIDLPGDYRCECFPGFIGKLFVIIHLLQELDKEKAIYYFNACLCHYTKKRLVLIFSRSVKYTSRGATPKQFRLTMFF